MPITPEQVARLCAAAHVDEIAALSALERTGGHLLDAMLDLEARGQVPPPRDGGCYSTSGKATPDSTPPPRHRPTPPPHDRQGGRQRQDAPPTGKAAWHTLRSLWEKALANHIEILRRGRPIASVPLLVLLVLVCAFFTIVVPLLLLGLLLGFRYRLSGPDLGESELNQLLSCFSNWLEELIGTIKAQFKGR